MSSKLVVPVALGLSLVTVTAFVVYYVFKKDEEESESKVKTTRINTIEVKVPKSITPVVIGRSGSNIKELERKTGAKLHFKKFTEGDHDICCIMGRREEAQLAETLVHEYIRNQPEIMTDNITVPGWSCGRIIGAGGENISEVCHRSGARVKVEGLATDRSADRIITIRGTKDQIQKAKELIDNHVAQEKCRREVEQCKSPRHTPRSASSSPAPAPAPAQAADAPDEPGDRSHAKYKRAEKAAPSIEVYVSAVSSPSRFWVQFVGAQVTQLDELVADMTDYYGKKENREAHALEHVSVGQVVAAVFRHDGRWYRARVHDIRPNEFDPTQTVADVFYLDYGDSEYVATHELCELKSDLLRLRFQAMECFLAGVRPAGEGAGAGAGAGEGEAVTAGAPRWDKWHPQAIERFEELAQVARWKSLVSRTCTYKKTVTADGEKEKEIPGIKLFDVTDEGELDIGAVLVEEGWAVVGAPGEHPPPASGNVTPFGDLGNSRVLGILEPGRSTSLPKDHKDINGAHNNNNDTKENDVLSASKSLTGLEDTDKVMSVSNFDLSYPETKPHLNGSHDDFLSAERSNLDKEASSETLTPEQPHSAIPPEFKANMNRIDSHHSNLETLGRSTHDLHK